MICLIQGNSLRIPLADGTVQTVITSPPYYGLRDYGTARWEGGSKECEHKGPPAASPTSLLGSGPNGKSKVREKGFIPYRDTCAKCGARRIDQQIGLEPTPEEYVQNIVNVFREVKRVLRDDGTCWTNLGDSYTGGNGKRVEGGEPYRMSGLPIKRGDGLKPKDLLGIPWRVAFALQADGWYLRSDIIWHKPNPMPESVTDRPTKSHEYLFLLSKNARYYYDATAIREPFADERMGNPGGGGQYAKAVGKNPGPMTEGIWLNGEKNGGRNRRDVWTIATSPYSGAHFAAFPPALVEPCILAGTSERGQCPKCGKAWVRTTAVEYEELGAITLNEKSRDASQGNNKATRAHGCARKLVDTTGWQPSCECNTGEPVPQIVLDPFAGTFTVGMVAAKHRRDAVGIELSAEYIKLARKRCSELQVRLF